MFLFCFLGSGHPAAHSGAGSLAARGSGLPGAAHAGAHPAQEAPGDPRGEEAQRSGAPGGPVLSRPHHETQEVQEKKTESLQSCL